MPKLLKKIQKNHELHTFLRNIYGKTIGFYFLKKWFVKKKVIKSSTGKKQKRKKCIVFFRHSSASRNTLLEMCDIFSILCEW